MTPTELHEAMIKAAMEAYDRVHPPLGVGREAFRECARERLSQVAQAVALEMVPVGEAARGERKAYSSGYRDGCDGKVFGFDK
jgi:hypothetical protein